MLWLKIIGWVFFVAPIIGFSTFSFWMIKEAMLDDDNIGAFVSLLSVIWIIGAGILVLLYFTDFLTAQA